jgi:hypothetical protein
MMNLQGVLKLTHQLLENNRIPHALIGGLALACYGSTRATIDLDILVPEERSSEVKALLIQNGFTLVQETAEVMQFSGLGYVDMLIARRPISQAMLGSAVEGGPEGIRFLRPEDLIGLKIQAYINDRSREYQDKADIQFLIQSVPELDWTTLKSYADLFGEWEALDAIRKKA